MNVVASILESLVKQYYESVRSGGVDCRIAIPGLTTSIAHDLHSALLKSELPSLLVVPMSELPNADRRHLRADGLTSLRQGSMLIVACPGEMSRIQDSILGAGGTVRNVSFSDEWPWVDEGNEYFRFAGAFSDAILDHWQAKGIDRAFLAKTMLAIVKASRGSVSRGIVVLEEVLGSFSPSLYPELDNLRSKFLFHCGVPAPDVISKASDWDVKRDVLDPMDRLAKCIAEARQSPNTRREALDRVEDLEPNVLHRTSIAEALENVLDGLAAESESQNAGLLTFRGCWGNDVNRWRTLDLPLLRRIFDPTVGVAEIKLHVTCAVSGGLVSADKDKAVLLEGEVAAFNLEYSGLSSEQVASARLVAACGNRELATVQCTDKAGQVSLQLSFEDIFGKSSKKRAVRVQLLVGQIVAVEGRVSFWPCGASVKVLVVVQPTFKVFELNANIDDEDVDKLEVDSQVHATLLRHDEDLDITAYLDDEEISLISEADKRLLTLSSMVDPGATSTGRVTLRVTIPNSQIEIEFESNDFERGRFTLEQELIWELGRGGKSKLAKILPVFLGTTNQPYAGLGGLTDGTRGLIRYARIFEDDSIGGLPIVENLLMPASEAPLSMRGWVVTNTSQKIDQLGSFDLSQAGKTVWNAYKESRVACIQAVAPNDSMCDRRWPKYAWFPLYVERRKSQIESAIVAYLKAYSAIVDYLRSPPAGVLWEELFVLSHLDSVVHWEESKNQSKVSLLGPWHPLVVSKRFMVQGASVLSAQRFQREPKAEGLNKLAMLLEQQNAVRWLFQLRSDGAFFDHALASATSDPGWLLVVHPDLLPLVSSGEVVTTLRRNLGLECSLLPVARERMAVDYLRGFQRAHPNRRAMALAASSIYSGERLVESAEALLYEGDEIAPGGRMLPGGLHLFLHDAGRIKPRQWRKPSICIYDETSTEWSKGVKDIVLLPPGRPMASRIAGKEFPIIRGRGNLAAFSVSLRRVLIGKGGIPTSQAFERDLPEPLAGGNLGDHFVSALAAAGSLSEGALAAGWGLELPAELNYLWQVIPGDQIDPAVLIQYVRLGFQTGQARVLWDYNMSLTGAANSYFVLSQVPSGVMAALNGSAVLQGKDEAKKIIQELAEIGVAVGGESLRSGSKALGVIGLSAATRLFSGGDPEVRPLRNDASSRGFLLPVDSFRDILGEGLDAKDEDDQRRADLVAIQIELRNARVRLGIASIECKYTSSVFSEDQIESALQQAKRSQERIIRLCEAAQLASGVPERLALVALISFGLRLRAPQDDEGLACEQAMLRAVLNGEIDLVPPALGNMVVITECEGVSARYVRKSGVAIHLSPGNWPVGDESGPVLGVRAQLSKLFRTHHVAAAPETPPDSAESKEVADTDMPRFFQNSAAAGGRLSPILLGASPTCLPIYYDPQSVRRPLDNYNMMITGSSGKGKTQMIKAIVADLRRQTRNVLLLDFKNDFSSDAVFLKRAGLTCRYITFDGLPYNPLIPMPVVHPGTGKKVIQISQHITGLSSVLGKTFQLGAQQEVSLKEVIRECYRDRGIDPSGTTLHDASIEFPDFNDVGDRLRQANLLAYNRMDPLFDLGVFSPSARGADFEVLLSGSSVIDLSQIQSDPIKNAIAKIILLSAHAFYNARPHASTLQQFFVFDEAHRVLDSDYLMRFVRECRAYGVGILLSSQYPSDFPQEVSASLNTKILHGNGEDRERVRDLTRILGASSDETEIAKLGMFEAFVSNSHYSAEKIKTLAYPHFLVLETIQSAGATSLPTLSVEGVDKHRLSLEFLVEKLMEMGLVEQEGEEVRVRPALPVQ